MSVMKVAILGCGPAGLMAAEAVAAAHKDNGTAGDWRMAIYSRARKSHLYGAQYLHRPIPGVTRDAAVRVGYRMVAGTVESYRRKVYGQMWQGSVSPEDLTEEHPAWDIRATYDRLWDVWGGLVSDAWLDPLAVRTILDRDKPDLVISSVPLDRICYRGHWFGATEIWAAGEAPDRGITLPYQCPSNAVLLHGGSDVAWYRISNVFGHKTVEWPGHIQKVPVNTAQTVRKPTGNDCDCWPGLLKVGRYGRWEKGILSHDAYFDTYAKVTAMLLRGEDVAAEETTQTAKG